MAEKTGNITVRTEKLMLPELRSLNDNGVPLLTVRRLVIFPHVLVPLMLDAEADIQVVKRAMEHDRVLGVFIEVPDEMPAGEDKDSFRTVKHEDQELAAVGIMARVVKFLTFPDGSVRLLLRGLKRITLNGVMKNLNGIPYALYDAFEEPEDKSLESSAMMRNAIGKFQEIAGILPNFPDELKLAILNMTEPGRVVDLMADALNLSFSEKLKILTLPTVKKRLQLMLVFLNRESEVLQLSAKIQSQVHMAMSQSQKEFYLREQLRAIQEELGEDNRNPDLVEFERRLAEGGYPEAVEAAARKEMSRLELIPQASPEYHVAYNYVDWLLAVPWTQCSDDCLDVGRAARVLNEDHYGLEDVKERILEFLSVLQLRKDRKSPILCLVGPPGVGKTSLGQSIARAMNRKFIRVALGGVRDEAEIRGHRRTYIGAMPGRIIQNMKKVGVANPVFMLDEIDKLGNDHRGDPASALLEVLDPEQNKAFNDHYIELDYDLSRVFFIATANVLEAIPAPLLDRMEVIRLPGYTSFEKKQIAKRYLVPKQFKENGLQGIKINFSMAAIDEIIDFYTREAGVRQLDRTIAAVCRKLARQVVEQKLDRTGRTTVTPEMVRELLGPRKFLQDEADRRPEIGSAVGMAWTSCGGTVLTVEAAMMPGKGLLKLTGSLGNVMKESAEAAFSYLRGHAARFNLKPEVFEKNDFHIHVPDGATPKDGPSAGVTLFSALLSLLTRKRVAPSLAMTGEINLRGRVTAVGGIKEKVIAALRAGVRTIMLPEENGKDLEEIPEELRRKLTFRLVKNVDEAVAVVFPSLAAGKKEMV